MTGDVRVGISGWRYANWRGDFYPTGLPQRLELAYVAERMNSVELNGSFYSLQRPESYRRWRDAVPDDFVFAVKGSRYITHMLRLRDVDTALANFLASGVLALGPKLGPMLWQLPERQVFDPEALDAFLRLLPRTTGEALERARQHDERLEGRAWLEIEEDVPIRHALEPRSRSFEDPGLPELLRRHGVALTVADTAGLWPAFGDVTADFVYVRLHGATALYMSGYTPDELDAWAARIAAWADGSGTPDGRPRDVYVYFDNDGQGHAPHDAVALARRVARPRTHSSATHPRPPACSSAPTGGLRGAARSYRRRRGRPIAHEGDVMATHTGTTPVSSAPLPPQAGFGAPHPAPSAPPPRRGMAITALVLAIVGFVLACIPFAVFLGGALLLAALILAIVALVKNQSKPLGISALIVSIVGTGIAFLVALFTIFLGAAIAAADGPGDVRDDVAAQGTDDQPAAAVTTDAEDLLLAETAWGASASQGSWFAVVVDNPNADYVYPHAPVEVKALGADGTVLDSYVTFGTLLHGRNAIAGALLDVGADAIADIEVTLPTADAAVASAAAQTGAFAIHDVVATTTAGMTTVRGTVTSTFDDDHDLVAIAVIARNADGAIVDAVSTFAVDVEEHPVRWEAYVAEDLGPGVTFEAYAGI